MTRGREEILPESPLDDRVLEAWRRLGRGQAETARIEIVRKSPDEDRAIYRLTATDGVAVIAKKCGRATGWIERTVYEQILPRVPVTAPRYLGFEEDDGFGWLFIEDVGGERFSPRCEGHRVLAARWLGVMHTTAARVDACARLPDRGPSHYLERMQSVRGTIVRHLADPRLGGDDRAVLKKIVGQCDALRDAWARVATCCEGVPATLVHGDFRRKNVYVRATDSGTGLFPIDWETAGWGILAADLAPSRSRYGGHHVDLDTYGSIVREHWPGMGTAALRQLMGVGLVFRRLADMYWASMSLGTEGDEVAVELLNGYRAELSEAMKMPPWDR